MEKSIRGMKESDSDSLSGECQAVVSEFTEALYRALKYMDENKVSQRFERYVTDLLLSPGHEIEKEEALRRVFNEVMDAAEREDGVKNSKE